MLVTFLSSENIYFTFTFPNWNFPWCSSNAFRWVSKKKKKKGNCTNIQEWIPFFFLFLTPTLPAPLKASLLWAHVAFHLTFLWSLALGIQFAIRRSPAYIYLIVIHHSVQKKKKLTLLLQQVRFSDLYNQGPLLPLCLFPLKLYP